MIQISMASRSSPADPRPVPDPLPERNVRMARIGNTPRGALRMLGVGIASALLLVACGSGDSTSGIEDSSDTTEPVGGVDLGDEEFEDLTGQDEVEIQA